MFITQQDQQNNFYNTWWDYFRLLGFENPASWPSDNAFVPGTVGLKFESQIGHSVGQADQIRHSVANDSPLLRHLTERSCVAADAMTRRWGPQVDTSFGVIQL